MTVKRINTPYFDINKANRFNLPIWWLGKVVNGIRLDTIILNLNKPG